MSSFTMHHYKCQGYFFYIKTLEGWQENKLLLYLLQMRKVRPRIGKRPGKWHTAGRWPGSTSLTPNPALVRQRPHTSTPVLSRWAGITMRWSTMVHDVHLAGNRTYVTLNTDNCRSPLWISAHLTLIRKLEWAHICTIIFLKGQLIPQN